MDSLKSDYKIEIDDNARKNFLYAAFPSDRGVNPKHWDSKLGFWTKEIENSAKQLGDIFVDVGKLKQRFICGSSHPLGLNVVVDELVKDGTLFPVEGYLRAFEDGWINWAFRMSASSVSWAWKKATGIENEIKEYVLLQCLKDKADCLLQEHRKRCFNSRTDAVVPWAVVLKYRVNDTFMDEKTATVIIGYLKQQGKVQLLVDEAGQKIVKFAIGDKLKADKVTGDDLKILKLKQTIAKLQLEQQQHLKEARRLRCKAKEMVTKDKEQSKTLLRESKRVAKFVEKRENQLSLLVQQLNRIKDMDNQKMVIDALDSSATLLKTILDEEGLTVDNVESTVSKVDEVVEDFTGFDNAITEGLKELELKEGIDIADLEKELMDMVLPSVPQDSTLEQVPSPSKETPSERKHYKDKPKMALEA